MLNQLARIIRKANQQKGFDLSDVQTGTQLMLVVSELSEALEAVRNGKHCSHETITEVDDDLEVGLFDSVKFEKEVKDTFEDELADALIRILDICAFYDIDIDKHVRSKMQYNATREHKHGKKF